MHRRLILKYRLILKWMPLAAISILFISLLSIFSSTNVAEAAKTEDPVRNTGSLQAIDASGKAAGECPLKHTTVKAEVSGFLSRVTVTQDFENPFPDKIEAVYTFPLPQSAAVDDLTMLIGERSIKGKIMRREEAQATYAAAKQLGKVAALLDQERPNIFTQAVANIMPGQQIRIVISYVETLQYEDGSYEWSFPMTIGPRYNPAPTNPTDTTTTDAGETATATTSAPSYATRAGHDISLELDLDAGVPIEALHSETHETEVERPDARRAIVRLKDQNTIPNKDFVLKYQVAGPAINDAVLAHRSDRGGFFTLILQPPQRVQAEDVRPKELVFVVDTSGSMSGFPLDKARETMDLALDTLYQHDTFNVITFSGDNDVLFAEPQPATRENILKAKKFLANKSGNGGTEMMKAVVAALKPSDSQQHMRIACFMTDGQVGNDMEIIAEIKKYKNARVFAMGFGHAPNRFLLDNMAQHGGGEVAYVTGTGDTSAVARRFNERVRNPLLTDISIEWPSSLPVNEIYPQRIPDLFGAKPVILSGRYLHGGKGSIVLRGKLAGQDFVREIPVELPDAEEGHDVLATLWARRKIDDVMGRDMMGLQYGNFKPELRDEITQLGLNFKLMTQFTSFVAVDEVIFTGPEPARRADVPLNTPGSIATGPIASVNCTVSVMASTELLNSSDTSLGAQVSTRALANLPINGRNLQSLVTLAPGTINTAGDQFANYPQPGIATNGQRPHANMFMVDGVSANFGITPGGQAPGPSAGGSTVALTASGSANGVAALEATQEMKVVTSSPAPEYGRVPGAQVNIVTRAGTNEFHGSFFDFFGHDSLDANDWFANSRGLTKPPRRLHNFGGTLGGPIQRDKIFFFGSYEGLRLRRPMMEITDAPSLLSRTNAAPEIQPFFNAFPLPTGDARPDGFAEFASTFTNSARHDLGSFRLDWIGENSNFRGKYSLGESGADQRGAGGFSLNTTSRIRSQAQTFTGSFTRTLSPSKVFELSANYSRLRVAGSQALDEFGGAAVPSSLIPAFGESFNFDLNSRGANLMAASEVLNVQRQFNTVAAFQAVSDKHAFKFGADYRRMSPSMGFRSRETNLLFDGVSQALTGVPARVGLFTRDGSQSPDFNNLSLYGQDEWRPLSRLTLTYGLRWELNPPPSNDGTAPLAVDQVNDPTQLKAAVPGRSLWETTYLNLAPRVGVAYNLLGNNDPDLVLRGGFGVLYDVGHERGGDAFVDSLPFVSGSGVPAIVFDPNLKLPYTLNWNIGLESALGSRQTLSASYVGTAGRRLLHTQTFFDQNLQFPFLRLTTNAGRSDYRALQVQFQRRLSQGLSSNVSYTWSRSFDNISEDSARNVLMTSANPAFDRGPSDFDARHRLSGYVHYDLPAPFATGFANKLVRNWSVYSIVNLRSAKPIDVVYLLPTSYGVAYFRPDVVVGEPLYIRDRTIAGGRMLNPAAFVVPAGFGQGAGLLPVAGFAQGFGTGQGAGLGQGAGFGQGNFGRNSLRGFPLYQIDFALRRIFNFTESFSLQFQADAFNVFNHPNFEDPIARERVLGGVFSAGAFTPNPTFGRSFSLLGQGLSGSSEGLGSFSTTGSPRTVRLSVKLVF